ncbi:MAG: hypothetical protein KJ601_07715 [Nanoarchaeota archaeon]|nr:hypothetical protein [Nanoarchaeota archaeon]MBU1703809.1 hypothetical protein [Nanoarchaeota archaeon]
MNHDIHHLNKRKRQHQKLAPYPHPDKWISFLDKLLVVVAAIGPLNNLPQIIKIYLYHNAAGVSPLSWLLYTIFDIPWIIYGAVHKEFPIVLAYVLWMITNSIVLIGALIY